MIILELLKMKRRKLLLIPCLIFLLGLIWGIAATLQSFDQTQSEMAQTTENALYTFSLLNSIFKPLLIVSLVTNICENEHRHKTFKVLFTNQQNRTQLFIAKWLLTSGILFIFIIIQVLGIFIILNRYDVTFSILSLLYFALVMFIPSLLLINFHLFFSLYFDKQLISIGFALFGSFVGIAAGGMLNRPLMFLLPWQHYRLLAPYGMQFIEQTVLFYENQQLFSFSLIVMSITIITMFITIILYNKKEV